MIHEQYYFHSELKPDMCESIIQIGHEIGFKPNGLFYKENNSSSDFKSYIDPKERRSSGASIPKSGWTLAENIFESGLTPFCGLIALILIASAATPHSPNVRPSAQYMCLQSNETPSS